jgi:hypothetical protein
MVAINYLGSAVCCLSIAIMAGLMAYGIGRMSGRMRTQAASIATIVFVAVLIGIPSALKGYGVMTRGGWRAFSEDDIEGTWIAAYEKYGCWQFTGAEILRLNSDGTYQQIFEDESGNHWLVVQNNWEMPDQKTVELKGAKKLPYYSIQQDCDNNAAQLINRIMTLRAIDKKLNVRTNLFAKDGMMLDLEEGDPDGPHFTDYFRGDSSKDSND